MSNITEQLKVARQALGIKQSTLGQKLGLPQSHISKIEQGATDPRLSTVVDMARVLDQELMLVPRQMISHVRSLLNGEREDERRFQPDEEKDA
ncbi:MAG: helix-turn-helix transcriptional regulator [Oxalobacter sp.]|nr:helix-turn-helix transcriptional regulator [Oxalobacter sp.]